MICPIATDVIDPKALSISGRTEEQVRKFETAEKTHKMFTYLLSQVVNKYDSSDKLFFLAYNARFDYDFMYAWFTKLGDKYCNSYFWSPPIDIMTLAAENLIEQRYMMKNFKLGTVAQQLQLSATGELHDALVDIRLAREVYYKCNKPKP